MRPFKVVFKLMVECIRCNLERLHQVLLGDPLIFRLVQLGIETLHNSVDEITLSSSIKLHVHPVVSHTPACKPAIRASIIVFQRRRRKRNGHARFVAYEMGQGLLLYDFPAHNVGRLAKIGIAAAFEKRFGFTSNNRPGLQRRRYGLNGKVGFVI